MNRFPFTRRGLRPIALMLAAVVSVLLSAAITPVAGQGGNGPSLRTDHPDRYVVQRGDTLWDISGMFLRDPWYWPEIWYVNPQVENPHLIYPGDLLTLVYVDGQPQLRLQRAASTGDGKLSPRVREQDLDEAITTIPFDVISAFLSKGTVLEKDEIDGLPYVAAIRDGRLIAGEGNDVYVRGDGTDTDSPEGFSVVRIGEPMTDPDDDTVVGYEGIFVGEGQIRRGGDPATLRLGETRREALQGDRLLDLDFDVPLNFYPRAPEAEIDGKIIHVVDGISQIGQYQVVVINRGARDGLETGNVLRILSVGGMLNDRLANNVMGQKIKLPDEPSGTLMVFKTYDRISYALIMEATSEIHTLDRVLNPA